MPDGPAPTPTPDSADRRQTLREAIQPVSNEPLDRAVTGFITVAPILLLAVAAWRLWNLALSWQDVGIMVVMYTVTGLGITVGFHRLFTHRSFQTVRPVRIALAILGSMAIEGPVVSWVADHRKHHAFSDADGDPHSPHVGHGYGVRAALSGLFHAHMGWLFIHTERGCHARFAKDLQADKDVAWVSKTFIFWALFSLFVPFGLGMALSGGSLVAGLTAMLWGGAVRIFLLHHVTYSINSLCHFMGRRQFDSDDHSRNVFWLALPSFGESWHNGHHAFPSSARHGLGRMQVDLSAMAIWGLEKVGLATNVVRVKPERLAAKTL